MCTRMDGVESLSPHRSFWLQEAVSPEVPPAPPLRGEERSDVCVVGGGYTGLWTALRLKEAAPSLDVTLLEADICGAGASGRNAGFALSWWVKAPKVVEICGEDDGIWLCHQAQHAIDEIGRWAAAHQHDIDYAKHGWLWTASSKAQLGAWDETLAFASKHGAAVYRTLEPSEVEERAGTPVFAGGVLDTTGATLQPARLARALRETAVRNGVRVFEGSPVRRLAAGSRPAAVTDSGRITADRIVLALGAWATELPELRGLRRAMIITSSDIVATEPIPQLLKQPGPRGREGISDSRLLVHYARKATERLIFGVAGGQLAFAGRIRPSFDDDRRTRKMVVDAFRQTYPHHANARITHSWSGPVERTKSGLPYFGRLPSVPGVVYGTGFSGNGVGPCWLAGHILTSLALGRDDRWASVGLVRTPSAAFPPEPVRFAGGLLVRWAIRARRLQTTGARAPPLPARALVRIAPAGLVEVNSPRRRNPRCPKSRDRRS